LFDTLVADACAKVYDGTGHLITVALDAPDIAREAIGAQRWPIEVKLHGDFRSRRLKNTGDELRQQDAKLRHILVDSCRQAGLVVAGYSGRDDSVMNALVEALNSSYPFPSGLFWLHRGADPPLPRVEALLGLASERRVDGGLVQVENFDEILRDLVRLMLGLDTTVLDAFASERRWSTPPARASGDKGFPVVRLNALPVKLGAYFSRCPCVGLLAQDAIDLEQAPGMAPKHKYDRYRLPPLQNAAGRHIGGIFIGHHEPHDDGQGDDRKHHTVGAFAKRRDRTIAQSGVGADHG
jgi:hypothetical protein